MLVPLAQVREPFSAIRWVMERSEKPLAELLGLKPVKLRRVRELLEAGLELLGDMDWMRCRYMEMVVSVAKPCKTKETRSFGLSWEDFHTR